MKRTARTYLTIATICCACGGTAVIDAGSGAGSGGGSSSSGTSTASNGTASSGTGSPMVCDDTPPAGDLCVRGEQTPGGEELVPGRPVRFELRAAGCYSSSCTQIIEASCSVMRSGAELTISTNFCLDLEDDPTVPCTDDCGGGGFAECSSEALEAGGYSATAGALTVLFTLPMTLPPGGACAAVDF